MRILGYLILAIALSVDAKKIRGLDPSKASLYQPGSDGLFACLDGSKKIPFDRVNDDYCDCKDGSDEPGTSACHNGNFFCANKGSTSVSLAAAFVDDGLCDCCDGSDEIQGCPNRCLEESAPLLQEMKDKLSVYTSALEKKANFQQEAVEKKTNWQKRSEMIHHEIHAATQIVEAARVEKERATEQHKNAQTDVEHLEAKARQEQEERRLQEEAAASAAAAEHASAQASSEQAETSPEAQAESHTQESPTPQEETDEERGRRIAAQWTTDPDAASRAEAAEDEGDLIPNEEEPYEFPDPPHYTPPSDLLVDSPELLEARQLSARLDAEKRAAEAKLSHEEQNLYDLQREQWHIQMFAFSTDFDFGPNQIFYPYAGRCFEDRAVQFLYKVCFYDRATQLMPTYPAHSVNLGVWTGLTSDYSQALFEGGDACDGHPNRSLRVFFHCSTEEKLHDTTEPSTCSYETFLDTPLACHDHEYQKLKESMEQIEAERNKIQAEIEAAKDEL